ncbi:hypothetical protein Tco_0789453 [Tanacetum coccineum]
MSSYHQTYSCELCENDSRYCYDCPQNSPSFQQQYLCCENCGGPHATFQCQLMNQNLYNSLGLDQFQPPQYSVVHQPPQETNIEMLQARENLMEAIQAFLKKYDQIPSEERCIALWRAELKFLKVKQAFKEEQNQPEIILKLLLQLIHDLQRLDEILPKQAEEKGTNKQDDDDDDDDYDEKKPKDSLIMEDEDINTIPEKESDEDNESSAENLVQNPSESKANSDNESECDLPIFDDFSSLDVFEDNCVIFSRPLFDSYADTTSSEYSSDNESIMEEDVFSNLPFEFDVESISSDVNPIYDEVLEDIDGTNYLIDSIIDFSPKIDHFLEEFADIRLIEKSLYDNSSPRPPEELNSETSIESFFLSPIPVEDSDSLMEEIDTFLAPDDSIPLGIDSDGYDSEKDNLFLECEPDPGKLTRVVDLDFTLSTDFSGSDLVVSFPSGNRNKTFDPGISIKVQSKRFLSLNKFSISFISDPLSSVLETLLPFSSENEDKVFNPGILVSKEEKSPHLLSHRGFKAFKIIHNFLNESSMMIYGWDIPILDVTYLHFYPP